MRLLRVHGSAKLGTVGTGSAMQSLWREDRKVGSQVICKDRSRPLGEELLGKLGKTRKKSRKQNEGVHRFGVGFGKGRRASCLPCLSLGDDRQSTSGSRDVGLTIFITSVSTSKSLTSFTKLSVSSTSADHQALGWCKAPPRSEKGAKKMSGEERWRRVGISGPLRWRR